MGVRPRVAFVTRGPRSGFIRADRLCLECSFEVEELYYPGWPTPAFVAQSMAAARRCDVLYAFFGSEHALLPALAFKLWRKPFILVPGGYDYANVPERGYGLVARGRGWLPKLLGRMSDLALAISEQTRKEFCSLVPSAACRSRVAYLGIDERLWVNPDVERCTDRVVTVAYVDTESWSRKGIDRFLTAARADPDREYVLCGQIDSRIADVLTIWAPRNVIITGYIPRDELRRLLWSSGVYVQLSWHESFGFAVIEAMLCGCRPVVTPVPALLEVTGRWAVVVDKEGDEVSAIAHAAREAIDRAAMRAEVAERFSLERRERVLAEAVWSVLH